MASRPPPHGEAFPTGEMSSIAWDILIQSRSFACRTLQNLRGGSDIVTECLLYNGAVMWLSFISLFCQLILVLRSGACSDRKNKTTTTTTHQQVNAQYCDRTIYSPREKIKWDLLPNKYA